jgi:hypothetical protein
MPLGLVVIMLPIRTKPSSRAFALFLLACVCASLARPARACPQLHHDEHEHHGQHGEHDKSSSNSQQQDCQMMTSCAGALPTPAPKIATLATGNFTFIRFESIHYISALLTHDPPPPKPNA